MYILWYLIYLIISNLLTSDDGSSLAHSNLDTGFFSWIQSRSDLIKQQEEYSWSDWLLARPNSGLFTTKWVSWWNINGENEAQQQCVTSLIYKLSLWLPESIMIWWLHCCHPGPHGYITLWFQVVLNAETITAANSPLAMFCTMCHLILYMDNSVHIFDCWNLKPTSDTKVSFLLLALLCHLFGSFVRWILGWCSFSPEFWILEECAGVIT